MIEQFFKRYFWVAQAAFAVAAALLLANALTHFAGTALAPYTVTVPPTRDAPEAGLDQSTVDLQIDPRTFPVSEPPPVLDPCQGVECEEDQVCNPSTGACERDETDEVEVVPSDGRCIESDIAINLVGTIVSDDAAWSMAVLHNAALRQTQFARLGTSLLAEAEVTRIERGRIFLMRNGREECLRPGDQSTRIQRGASSGGRPTPAAPRTPGLAPTPVASAPSAVAPSAPAAGGGSIEQRVATEIRRVDDNNYELPRSLIQEVANNASLMEQHAPRVVPHYENGQPRGFRLQNVRPGTIFSAIGIRNGDVIVGVNGTTIDSPQRALELYQAMLSQDSVQLAVLRRSREQTISYTIR